MTDDPFPWFLDQTFPWRELAQAIPPEVYEYVTHVYGDGRGCGYDPGGPLEVGAVTVTTTNTVSVTLNCGHIEDRDVADVPPIGPGFWWHTYCEKCDTARAAWLTDQTVT